MKSPVIRHPLAVAVTLVASLAFGAAVVADDGRHRHDRHDQKYEGRHWDGDRDRRDHDGRFDHDRKHDRRDWGKGRAQHRDERHRIEHHRHGLRHQNRQDAHYWDRGHVRYRVGQYHRPYGYRHGAWHVGARLPAAYCAPRYVVHDYGAYRLHRPPRGHHWVRVDNDVVLAAIAGGAVVQVVNDIFF